jgi:ribonuclease HI
MKMREKYVYYSVPLGNKPGIYETWDEAKKQTIGYPGAKYKKFHTYNEALDFFNNTEKEPERTFNPKAKKTINDYFRNLDRTVEKDDSIRNVINLKSKNLFITEDKYEEEEFSFKDNIIDVFTDGCCLNNGKIKKKKAGYGIYFPKHEKFNVSNPFIIGDETNNRAELFALIHLLNLMPYVIDGNTIQVVIHTDSKYCIYIYNRIITIENIYSLTEIYEVMNNHKKHKYFNYKENENILKKYISNYSYSNNNEDKNNNKEKYIFPELRDYKNIDLVLEFFYLIKKNKIKFILKHVRAHQKNDNYFSINNNKVDKLAKDGALKDCFKIIENNFT